MNLKKHTMQSSIKLYTISHVDVYSAYLYALDVDKGPLIKPEKLLAKILDMHIYIDIDKNREKIQEKLPEDPYWALCKRSR